MSFDFLGTFSKQDLENLRTYLQGELTKADSQMNHMMLESNKLQKTLQIMLAVAEKRGIKFKTFEQSFYKRVRSQYDDSDSATLVQLTKQPYYRNLKFREQFEFRIKKLLDKIEQLQEQMHQLRMSKSEFTANIEKLNSMFDATHPFLTVESEVTSGI
jgi:chromosome segregation ATPase